MVIQDPREWIAACTIAYSRSCCRKCVPVAPRSTSFRVKYPLRLHTNVLWYRRVPLDHAWVMHEHLHHIPGFPITCIAAKHPQTQNTKCHKFQSIKRGLTKNRCGQNYANRRRVNRVFSFWSPNEFVSGNLPNVFAYGIPLKAYLLRQKDGLYTLVSLASPRWPWCPGEYLLVPYGFRFCMQPSNIRQDTSAIWEKLIKPTKVT